MQNSDKDIKKKLMTKKNERIAIIAAIALVLLLIVIFAVTSLTGRKKPEPEPEPQSTPESVVSSVVEPAEEPEPIPDVITSEEVRFDSTWENAQNSEINTGSAVYWHAKPSTAKGITVCINAGHGTEGGSSVKTLCHPDGTPKVTGGTTEAGQTMAVAVSTGTELKNGTEEAKATLEAAIVTKEKLLANGYDVLMIRESDDVQLDNIARTLIANHYADAHIALHYDGTDWDKGVFFMSVPSASVYREMEPVASHFEEHNALGRAVVRGIESEGLSLFDGGEMEMDLTQTSYSEIPSIDLEIGDTATDPTPERLERVADGILTGLNDYFGLVSELTDSAENALAPESFPQVEESPAASEGEYAVIP